MDDVKQLNRKDAPGGYWYGPEGISQYQAVCSNCGEEFSNLHKCEKPYPRPISSDLPVSFEAIGGKDCEALYAIYLGGASNKGGIKVGECSKNGYKPKDMWCGLTPTQKEKVEQFVHALT